MKLFQLLELNWRPLTIILLCGFVGYMFGSAGMGLAIGLAFCSAMTLILS